VLGQADLQEREPHGRLHFRCWVKMGKEYRFSFSCIYVWKTPEEFIRNRKKCSFVYDWGDWADD
jgi:hypothetical protein